MNEQDIRRLIEETLHERQYGIASTSFHTHNGVDSQALQFIKMRDVPASYYQQAGKLVVVNVTENALQFLASAGTTGQVLTSNGTGALPSFATVSVKTYPGSVASDGTAGTPFPSGWTASRGGVGQYTITHNLGTANYAIIAMCQTGGKEVIYQNLGTNSVDIWTFGGTGTGADSSFNFILALS